MDEAFGVVPQPDASDSTGDGADRSLGDVPTRRSTGRREEGRSVKPLRERLAWRKALEIFRPR